MTVSERVAAYAAAYYRAKARWPTLAETAAALELHRSTIKDCASDGDYEFSPVALQQRDGGELRGNA